MKKIIVFLFSLSFLFSCKKERPHAIINVTVKGLKKGTAYLHKIQDSTLTIVDSVVVNGHSEFSFNYPLSEPEVLYLSLDKNDTDNSSIPFFADEGITDIQTTWDHFYYDAKIKGSEQQTVLENYNAMIDKYNSKSLDLIKAQFDARKNNALVELDSLLKVEANYIRSKYLFTVNYAITNRASEASPYLVLHSIHDANIRFLDTIYRSLTPRVKTSKYGEQLGVYIEQRRKSVVKKKAN